MARAPIMAAGGIVVRSGRMPLIAIVQLRRRRDWMLPKGKLNRGENARAAAKREVLEETGHRVSIHEFLGTISYDVGGKPKVAQFWRMEANAQPVRELMHDVRAVAWLPLHTAIKKLSHPREQVFLRSVGPVAIKGARQSPRTQTRPTTRKSKRRIPRTKLVNRLRTWLQPKKSKRTRRRRK
jgi:8-oxo-dGTP diphosphatase